MSSRFERERPRCPFYGFAPDGKYLMDLGQNNCGLLMPMLRGCSMEGAGLEPDSSHCPVFRFGGSRWNDMLREYVVFPEELQPEEGGLTGVPFEIWADMIAARLFEGGKAANC